jgi:hypothetical protein
VVAIEFGVPSFLSVLACCSRAAKLPPTDVVKGDQEEQVKHNNNVSLIVVLNVHIFVHFASHHRLKVSASSSHRAEAHRRVGGFECGARRFGEDKTAGCDTPNPVQVAGWGVGTLLIVVCFV